MNEFDERSSYSRHGGPLARPASRAYASPYSSSAHTWSPHSQRRYPSSSSSHYVTSEAADAIPLDAGYMSEGYQSSRYDRHGRSFSSRAPIDESSEDIARQMREQDRMGVAPPPPSSRHYRSRTPGYVTSLDNSPSFPMPHSSLSSANAYGILPLEQSTEYVNPLYDQQAMAYAAAEDPYTGGDWSSDGSSEASHRGYGRQSQSRHRHYPGQHRLTEYGREVFDGFEWVPESESRDMGSVGGLGSITRSGYRTRSYRY
ncbi:hypothetical protein SISNIDRAFT_547254 [Sistotremastrum niveocremeum HHB9708]|uniref:Uncharacterized protein n=2 Tax=Sistotremastraceae TaxID=3402574 RepID=A0A164YTD2_9AGAM|nr:hypothetical protein SISNIDRAFT_547254 [Sistotremastrum niveocremeum HHB9708]KZT41540.1 hypothetical protein SISSUDRAFT_1126314 [Sistotremastrum suecicum HHB10207 ss-3]